jgi:hypothetical protein
MDDRQPTALLELIKATDCSTHLSHGRDLEHFNLRRLHSLQHSVARRREMDIVRFSGQPLPSAVCLTGIASLPVP